MTSLPLGSSTLTYLNGRLIENVFLLTRTSTVTLTPILTIMITLTLKFSGKRNDVIFSGKCPLSRYPALVVSVPCVELLLG